MNAHHNHAAAGAVPSPLETIPQLKAGALFQMLLLCAGELILRSIMCAATWRARANQRRDLLLLDDRLLEDIGITREQARLESGKPFWRA